MKPNRRSTTRPYVRQRSGLKKQDAHGAASRLADLAGRAQRPDVEPLEPRQLLFALTVDPSSVDPTTGVGIATAYFGYTIPYLQFPDDIGDDDDELVDEDFDEEGGNGTPVISQTVFDGSNLFIQHNITPSADIQLVSPPGVDPSQSDEARVQVLLQEGEQFTLSLVASEDRTDLIRAVRSVQLDFFAAPGSTQGLDLQNTRVNLLFQGQVVESFEGVAELEAFRQGGVSGSGVGTFLFAASPILSGEASPAFDSIQFVSIGGPSAAFQFDNYAANVPPGNFADLIEGRIFGVEVTLAGLPGTTAEFFDLYGRPIIQTIAVGIPDADLELPIVDRDDNGVPDFNDGIGRIILSNYDAATTLTIFGGTIEAGDPDPDADFSQGGFNFVGVQDLLGFGDQFEEAGFGFRLVPDGDGEVDGLPPAAGSVALGSPYFRDNTSQASYNPAGLPATRNFVDPDQGIFALGTQPLGSVMLHGMLFGNSVFNGPVDRLAFMPVYGSVTVKGDLGTFVAGSEAGHWVPDDTNDITKTGGQLIVERTLGQVHIAGRSLLDTTVVGDLSSPATRPAGDIITYFELEFPLGIDTDGDVDTRTTIEALLFGGAIGRAEAAISNTISPVARFDQAPITGGSYFRNDSIGSAEFIGNAGSQVQVIGDIGYGDPVNTAEDAVDVYAIALDGTRPVIIEASTTSPAWEIRIVDARGRQVAAVANDETLINTGRYFLEYTPEYAGVYYIVISDAPEGDLAGGFFYALNISGLAPVTLGTYRTGSGLGTPAVAFEPGVSTTSGSMSLNVLSGAMGSIRAGTGYSSSGGGQVSADEAINFTDEGTATGDAPDERANLAAGSYTITGGDLFEIYAGSDIETTAEPLTFQIGGNLGYLITGQSPIIGVNPNEGDVLAGPALTFNVSGSIGFLDIAGGLGIDQDVDTLPIPGVGAPSSISFRTGLGGGAGDIGFIRVGSHVGADTVNIVTSPGSTIGGFVIVQDVAFDPEQIFLGIDGGTFGNAVNLDLGAGSDLRFFDTPRIVSQASARAGLDLLIGETIELVDDAGGTFTITVSGGGAPGTNVGFIRFIAIDGSDGVALGTIEVDLSGGRTLTINGVDGTADDVISIGRIDVQNADGQSDINITGDVQIDVWQIVQTGGGAFDSITNQTPGGDIVAIDVAGINTVDIEGDLGRTQVSAFGPTRISPFYGINGSGIQGILGPETFQIIAATIEPDWNGQLYRPIGDTNYDAGNGYLSDLGSPLDPYLDGLFVRGGNVALVSVEGSVGDIILAPTATLTQLNVDDDDITSASGFDGIFGTIYAGDINSIDVGDGVVAPTQNSLSTSGIFAADDIIQLIAEDAVIAANIIAGNAVAEGGFGGDNGIIDLDLSNTLITDAFIGANNLDVFWLSINYGDDFLRTGEVQNIIGTDGTRIFRTQISAGSYDEINIDGDLDAVQLDSAGDLRLIQAANIINSTAGGTARELFRSLFLIDGDVDDIILGDGSSAGPFAGVLSDTTFNISGEIENGIDARLVQRSDIGVAGTINNFDAEEIRSTQISTGQIVDFEVVGAIRASEISVSGPLASLVADEITGTAISITGPDGRLDLLQVRTLFDGAILATGPIALVEATEGDLKGSLITRTARGNVDALVASRDILLETDISGTLTSLDVGRNLGAIDNPTVFLVRGDLAGADISGGGLYSDLRVGDNVTGPIVIGGLPGLPGNNQIPTGTIEAFGNIGLVTINGDFGGSIISHSGGIGDVIINNGSLLPQASVSAFNSSINNLVINSGHLLGDVHADRVIFNITLNGSEDGVFGDIGVNPELSSFAAATSLRNQLPPGVGVSIAFDGPRITAGEDVGNILLTNGSIFETLIFANDAIGGIRVTGNIQNDGSTSGFGTQIVAGNSIFLVEATGSISNAFIGAGIFDLGADGRAGGTGDNADAVKSGRVRTVSAGGDATNVAIASGIVAGADGIYNTADDLHAMGISIIQTVTVGGAVTNVSAHTDTGLPNATAGITTGGQATPVAGGALATIGFVADQSTFDFASLGTVLTAGEAFEFTRGVATGTITFSGPGTAIWDAAQGRLLLVSTSIASTVQISNVSTGALEDFDIITNDDASIGRIDVDAVLFGDSDIIIDGFANEIVVDGFFGTGDIFVGNDIQLLQTGTAENPGSLLTEGEIRAVFLRNLVVTGDLGGETPQRPGEFTTPTITIFGTAGIEVGGGMRAVISADNGIQGALSVAGGISDSRIRSGDGIGQVNSSNIMRSRISAANGIAGVTVPGSVFDTSIIAGADLGRDGSFGGTGLDADSTNGGNIGAVTVGGNFRESDVVAGLLRGPDGFFGTSDDLVSGGRSNTGPVSIAGSDVGSNRGSESYGVFATGEVGLVTVGGLEVDELLNFSVDLQDTLPGVFTVEDISVAFDGGVYIASITFNQAMDAASVREGLLISEVRDGGVVTIRLNEGVDYLFDFDDDSNTALVTFLTTVTERDLPLLPGLPAPGLYRFELDPGIVQAQNVAARLDADGDGFADEDTFFSADAFVGDVGDKINPGVVTVDRGLLGPGRVDFYGPGSLDVALDDNLQPDALPDINTTFTLQGFLGDHPDSDAQAFALASDVDVYTITLQAGQILRLGANTGSAFNAGILLLDEDGFGQLGFNTASITLPADTSQLLEGVTTFGNDFLITETGTFFLVVTNGTIQNIFDDDGVENILPAAGLVGSYEFTLQVFDDGDSGFTASTNSGDGRRLIEAPSASAFAGADGTLGTTDDRASITVGAFTFTVDAATGEVTGTDSNGVTSSRDASGTSTVLIESAIGNPGARGLPGDITADVDVYHLNNRQNLQAGDLLEITVKLSETGADLGGRRFTGTLETITQDFAGSVQLALFNTTNSTGVADGELVFSPTEFLPSAAEGPAVFAEDDILSYGTDENGDFFIVTQVPETGTYAVYLQGVFNADYQIEVQRSVVAPGVEAFAGPDGTFGTFDDIERLLQGRFRYTFNAGPDGTPGTADDSVDGALIPVSQNVLIEFDGGEIDWLEVGGQITELLPYSSSALGFTGTIDDIPVDRFVRDQVVDNLNSIFQSAGFDVTFSENAGDFEFQDFSTVFVTDTADPVNFTFSADPLGFFFNPFAFEIGGFNLGFEEIFGYSERSDAFNIDGSDEAAVFVPQLIALGFNPSESDVTELTESLSAAIGRRVGELLGLRTTTGVFPSPAVDVLASNSPGTTPTGGGSYVIPDALRRLSTDFDALSDTDFFLGAQNSASLLDLILADR
ncbi:MAG: hypothetical protein AAFX79_06175 [Planctomycetota bacterium]